MSECSLTKEKFIEMASSIETLQEQKKDIADTIKEQVEACSEEYNIEKKYLNRAIKEYIKYSKDKAKYVDETRTVDQLLINVIE